MLVQHVEFKHLFDDLITISKMVMNLIAYLKDSEFKGLNFMSLKFLTDFKTLNLEL